MGVKTGRIIISGNDSRAGKSLLCLGLALALKRRGLTVSCLVTKPSIAEAQVYNRVTQRFARVLDPKMLNLHQLLLVLHQVSSGSNLVLIDGSGNFEPSSIDDFKLDTDSGVSIWSKTSVVLVIDVSKLQDDLIKVVQKALGGHELPAQLVLNHVGDKPFSEELSVKQADEILTRAGLPNSLGGIPDNYDLGEYVGSEAGFKPILLSHSFLVELERLIESSLDIDLLIKLAEQSNELPDTSYRFAPLGRRCRIGIAQDSCFGMCIQDNLDLLRFFGAELVPFSPLADTELPERLSGIYITGGNLVDYGPELSANRELLASIRNFAESGGVVYSEGSGTAYLCEDYVLKRDEVHGGAGVLPGIAEEREPNQSYYTQVSEGSILIGAGGELMKGISARDWKFVPNPGISCSTKIVFEDSEELAEGFQPLLNTFCTFGFLHFGSRPEVARQFVDVCEARVF